MIVCFEIKVLASLTSDSSIFVVLLFEKNGSVGRWKTKHFIGMP